MQYREFNDAHFHSTAKPCVLSNFIVWKELRIAWNTRANLAPHLAEMLETAREALTIIAGNNPDDNAANATERAAAALAELERLAGLG